jgi:glycosyltransferase involved in cell wall biosynthesis
MKILMVVNELAFSGVPAAAYNLTLELKRLDYTVFVVSANDGPQRELYEKMGVVVKIIPAILTDPAISYELAKQVDLVMVHTLIGYQCIYGAAAANTPTIWGIHEPEFGVQMATNNAIIRNSLELATEVVFPSKWSVDNYSRFVNKDKVNLIYTGTPIKAEEYVIPFDREENSLYLVQMGSIEHRKGQDVAIKAMQLVKNPIKLIISGRTLDQNYYNKLNESLVAAETKSVKFTGILNESAKKAVLQHVDALLMPSRDELIATVVIEAQALGKPVIASNVGALSEAVIPNKTGYLFDSEDHEELAEKLDLLYTEKEKRESFGKTAKHLYESERSYKKFLDSYIDLICSTVGKRRPLPKSGRA